MAITNRAGVLAGLMPSVFWTKAATATMTAGRPQSLYLLGGSPAAGSSTASLTGAAYSSSSAVPAGMLYHQDPPSGNAYLARLRAVASQPGKLLLCDRLWDCEPAVASTSSQSIVTPTVPNRDAKGGNTGYGLQAAIEVQAATSATAATISMSYTNTAGTAGQTGAFIDAPIAVVTTAGNFFRIGLAAGDLGIKSVQSVTFASDWTTGTIALVIYRVIAALDLAVANVSNMLDDISSGFPQLFNGSSLFFVFVPQTTTAAFISGEYLETQG